MCVDSNWMTLSDGQLVLSLLKPAAGRLETAVTQSLPPQGTYCFQKTKSSSGAFTPSYRCSRGHSTAPDLHQKASLAILWTSTLRLKHRQSPSG